jgi:hypothetical protein
MTTQDRLASYQNGPDRSESEAVPIENMPRGGQNTWAIDNS